MPFTVRPCTHADTAAVTRLLDQLGYPSRESEVDERLHRWIDDPRNMLLLAEDIAVVGLAALGIMPFLEKDGYRVRLMALVVDEDHRGRGVARLLLQEVERTARVQGAVDLEVTSSRSRDAAHRFYAAEGFAEISQRSARYLKLL